MTLKPTYEELEQRVRILEKERAGQKHHSGSREIHQTHLEEILNNTTTPVYLKDAGFKYIFINRQFENLAQVTFDQVKGKEDFDIFEKSIARIFRSQDEEVVKRRTLLDFEETILLPDGLQTFVISKFPIFDKKGNVSAVGGVCTDITARKKAEAELKEAEEKYRSIFEHSPLGILLMDKHGIITEVNEKLAEIFRRNVDRIIGYDLLKSIPDEQAKEAVVTVLAGKTSYYEGNCQFRNSTRRVYFRGVFAPLGLSEGAVITAIGIFEDISRRKEAELSLQKAYHELEQKVADRTAQLNQKTKRLMETNGALNILLEKREKDKKQFEEEVLFKVEKLIYPYLDKIKVCCSAESQKSFLEIVHSNLEEITSSFTHTQKDILSSLTPAQIQIADLIKQGMTTKEIASLLNLSIATIQCHRQAIRKRLSLTNKKINLRTALSSQPE